MENEWPKMVLGRLFSSADDFAEQVEEYRKQALRLRGEATHTLARARLADSTADALVEAEAARP